jgi:hypothetical protein
MAFSASSMCRCGAICTTSVICVGGDGKTAFHLPPSRA